MLKKHYNNYLFLVESYYYLRVVDIDTFRKHYLLFLRWLLQFESSFIVLPIL